MITAADPTCLKKAAATYTALGSLAQTHKLSAETRADGENITRAADPAAGAGELPPRGFDFPKPAPEAEAVDILLS